MSKCLLIGGPRGGELIEVDPSKVGQITLPNLSKAPVAFNDGTRHPTETTSNELHYFHTRVYGLYGEQYDIYVAPNVDPLHELMNFYANHKGG